jgi:hypothetical protein
MTQADLFTTSPRFDGATLDIERDQSRLARQLTAVRLLMLDGQWRTLGQIHDLTGYPESSVSARLRDLRKLKFGGMTCSGGACRAGCSPIAWVYPCRVMPSKAMRLIARSA